MFKLNVVEDQWRLVHSARSTVGRTSEKFGCLYERTDSRLRKSRRKVEQ